MKNKKLKINVIMYLIISLLFIIPLNISQIYAEENSDNTPDGSKTISEIENTCSVTPPMNIKDSLILSMTLMCIPGVLEKLMELKQIKCQKVVCKYEAVKSRLDPAFCNKQAAYKTCKYTIGEIFALPPMAIVEYLRKKVADIIANPEAMVLSLAMSLITWACAGTSTCGEHTLIANFATATVSIIKASATIKRISEEGFTDYFTGGDIEDYCEQIPEIEKEMKQIVSE